MKKAISAVLAAVVMMVGCGGAHAQANPDLVVNSTGTEVMGIATELGVAPASQSASGKTIVLYSGSTGWQNIEDTTGSKYIQVRDRLILAGAVEVGNGTGIYYVPSRMVRTGCQNNGSYVQADNTSNPRTDYMVNDGCAYRDKVRAKAPVN